MVHGDARVSREGPFARLTSSIHGALFGIVLYVATIALIAWNEGDYVTQKAVLASAESAVEVFACNDTRVHHDGQALVFLEGCTLGHLPLWKSSSGGFDFGGDSVGAWMETKIEMWQWKETEHSSKREDTDGGRTTVRWWTHRAAWRASLTPSPRHCDQPGYSSACDGP